MPAVPRRLAGTRGCLPLDANPRFPDPAGKRKPFVCGHDEQGAHTAGGQFSRSRFGDNSLSWTSIGTPEKRAKRVFRAVAKISLSPPGAVFPSCLGPVILRNMRPEVQFAPRPEGDFILAQHRTPSRHFFGSSGRFLSSYNLAVGYTEHMSKTSKAARMLGRLSVKARRRIWGRAGFRKKMRDWGKLGGRPRLIRRKRKVSPRRLD